MICDKDNCNFELDLDGQVTCSQCGAMNKTSITLSDFESQVDFE
jgi:hypothetical protein